MRLLLDTHIFLWVLKGDNHLSKPIRAYISHADDVYISSASIWEIAIKVRLKKLDANMQSILDVMNESGLLELPITTKHAAFVAQLPDINRDPFDRILIAQTITEPLHFLTADSTLSEYSDLVEVVNSPTAVLN